MTTSSERREELLAAAATDALVGEERAELDALLRDDPSARTELASLRESVTRLDAWAATSPGGWDSPSPSATLDARIAGIAAETPQDVSSSSRTRRARLVLAAALLVVAGAGSTLGVQALTAERPVEGPPGTLGAVEPLSPVPGESALPGRVQASFVAHTWGTEAVLDVAGTRPGAVYDVYVVDRGGREVPAGAFLGSRVTVHCRMNAAVLREDVAGLRIADAEGATVAAAQAPLT